jgi:hypothetical protein
MVEWRATLNAIGTEYFIKSRRMRHALYGPQFHSNAVRALLELVHRRLLAVYRSGKIVLRLIAKFQRANTPVVRGPTRGYLDCSGVVAGWISAHTRCRAYIPTIDTRGLPYRGT